MSGFEPTGPDESPITPAPPSPAYSPTTPFEPDLPQFIPVARPLAPEALLFAQIPHPPADPLTPPLKRSRAIFEILILVPAGFFGGLVGYVASVVLGVHDERWQLMTSTIGMGTAAVVTVAVFVFIDGQRPAAIGWTARSLISEIPIGIFTLLVTYMSLMFLVLTAALMFPSLLEQESTAQKAVQERIPDMSLAAMVGLMLLVAVWEEVVFRGFVLTRLRSLLGRWWAAVPVSAVIFGSVHIYEGPVAVAMIMVLGVMMGTVFVWRRSLAPCIVMHFIHNVLMLLLMNAIASSK